MRLEPVAEGASQHARRGARRTAFHDVMLPIEEVGGIPGIKRKRLKFRERSKRSGCPFPAVAQQIPDTKSAPPFLECVHRHRIPALKIKIPQPGTRRFGSPGV